MGGSYSSSYIEPTKKLEEKMVEIITRREILPMIIHRCSKLTKDKNGYNIWLDVCNFVYNVTPSFQKIIV